MTGASQGGCAARVPALVTSCIVASGEVHGQGTSGTLDDSVADLLEVSQPSRQLIPTNDDSRFPPAGAPGPHGGVMGAMADSVRLLSMPWYRTTRGLGEPPVSKRGTLR